MVKFWGQNKGAYAVATLPLATVLLAAGCGTPPARGQSAAQPPAGSRSSAPSGRPAAPGAQAAAAIWLDSLQMTPASTGWGRPWAQGPPLHAAVSPAPAR